ncbi:BREX-3 system P-loop-containing protein BrxF [Neptunomonas sp.]|uniref:BREX-3 system P-loop-containing protein BrxF n=1 Tax=Neptunomonas TaxID=75687 RepID=UPI0035150E03
MDRLSDAVSRAFQSRSRLLFLTAEQIELTNYPSININRQLSEKLIHIPKQDRAKSVSELLNQLISAVPSDVVCLTGLEILFDRSLAVNPIRLLSTFAKNKTLLISWPGEETSMGLSYAAPNHPESRTYKSSVLNDVVFLTADAELD